MESEDPPPSIGLEKGFKKQAVLMDVDLYAGRLGAYGCPHDINLPRIARQTAGFRPGSDD
jgi:hypothetical protein